MDMEIQFAIVRSENAEYLCYKEDKVYTDVSNPMMTFTVGEDAFEVVNPDTSFMRKEYTFRENGITSCHGFTGMAGWRSHWKR